MEKTIPHNGLASRPKAYSYLRFSTPDQIKGHSLERQLSKAREFALERGLQLDEDLTFQDLGKSAFRSANLATGRLGDFLEHVTTGQVAQGSYLLVESLDRLSRDSAFDAQHVLGSIVRQGVVVVSLIDRREYSMENLQKDPMALMYAIVGFMRAHDESSTKSSRLRDKWAKKRSGLQEGTPLTSMLPAWLKLSEDRKAIDEVPERVELVRRIFKMAMDGVGQQRIASILNEEQLATWGTGKRKAAYWHRSYITKVLTNPAVVGRFTPHLSEFDGHKRHRKALEPIEGYFPVIIPPEDFQAIQTLKKSNASPRRGRHAHAPVSHFLAGLAKCPKCGTSMTRTVKGKKSRPAYVCNKAKSGAGCEYRSVRCDWVEAALVHGLPERLKDLDGATGNVEELEWAVVAAQERVQHLEERVEFYADELFAERSEAIRDKLRASQAALEEARKAVRVVQERVDAASGLTVKARVQRVIKALLQTPEGPDYTEVNSAMRLVFARAVLDWKSSSIDLEWRHGGICTIHYTTFAKQPGWRWEEEGGEAVDEHQAV